MKKKSGSSLPKKRRGAASREVKELKRAAVVVHAAESALVEAEKTKQLLLQVIAVLVRELVKSGPYRCGVPFSAIARELTPMVRVVNHGKPDALVEIYASHVRIGDRVNVTKWRALDPETQTQPQEDPIDVEWRGVVSGSSRGPITKWPNSSHVTVELDPDCGAPYKTIDVWRDWVSIRVDSEETKSEPDEMRDQGWFP